MSFDQSQTRMTKTHYWTTLHRDFDWLLSLSQVFFQLNNVYKSCESMNGCFISCVTSLNIGFWKRNWCISYSSFTRIHCSWMGSLNAHNIDKNWLFNNLSIHKINKLHHGKCFVRFLFTCWVLSENSLVCWAHSFVFWYYSTPE